MCPGEYFSENKKCLALHIRYSIAQCITSKRLIQWML